MTTWTLLPLRSGATLLRPAPAARRRKRGFVGAILAAALLAVAGGAGADDRCALAVADLERDWIDGDGWRPFAAPRRSATRVGVVELRIWQPAARVGVVILADGPCVVGMRDARDGSDILHLLIGAPA